MQLSDEPNFEVIGDSAEAGRDGVEKSIALNPDVIIIDLQLPGMNGIEAMRQITSTNTKVKVIVFLPFMRMKQPCFPLSTPAPWATY